MGVDNGRPQWEFTMGVYNGSDGFCIWKCTHWESTMEVYNGNLGGGRGFKISPSLPLPPPPPPRTTTHTHTHTHAPTPAHQESTTMVLGLAHICRAICLIKAMVGGLAPISWGRLLVFTLVPVCWGRLFDTSMVFWDLDKNRT